MIVIIVFCVRLIITKNMCVTTFLLITYATLQFFFIIYAFLALNIFKQCVFPSYFCMCTGEHKYVLICG